jgi:hypothetical protein
MGPPSWDTAHLLVVLLSLYCACARACSPTPDSDVRGDIDLMREVLVTDPALSVTIAFPEDSQMAMPMAMVAAPVPKPGATVSTASTPEPVYTITVKCSSCPQAKMQALADLMQPYIKAASEGPWRVSGVFMWNTTTITPTTKALPTDQNALKLLDTALKGNKLYDQTVYLDPKVPRTSCDPSSGAYAIFKAEVVQFEPCNRAMELRGLTNSCNMFAADAIAEVLVLKDLKVTQKTATKKT